MRPGKIIFRNDFLRGRNKPVKSIADSESSGGRGKRVTSYGVYEVVTPVAANHAPLTLTMSPLRRRRVFCERLYGMEEILEAIRSAEALWFNKTQI